MLTQHKLTPTLPKGWIRSIDGNTVIWKNKPSARAAFGFFFLGVCFLAVSITAILISLELDDYTYAPLSNVFLNRTRPPWNHPLDSSVVIVSLFHLTPVVFFVLCAWCIGGERTIRISTNRLERKIKWFRWSRAKVFTDGTLLLEAISDERRAQRAHVWKWSIKALTANNRAILRLESGSYLKTEFSEALMSLLISLLTGDHYWEMEFPEAIISELSRLTGWPAKTIFRYQEQPPPSILDG